MEVHFSNVLLILQLIHTNQSFDSLDLKNGINVHDSN